MKGTNMAVITVTVTVTTKMERGQMEDVPLNSIVEQPTLNSVQHLANQLAIFAIHFATTKWGGKHGILPLVSIKTKMCLAAGDNNINCKRLSKPEFFNPIIKDNTKGREILQLQE